jgi:hypothetical protein
MFVYGSSNAYGVVLSRELVNFQKPRSWSNFFEFKKKYKNLEKRVQHDLGLPKS